MMPTYRDIAKIFEEIELRLIQSLKRNLNRHRQEEQQENFRWSAWQAEKLKNIERFRRENRSIMNEYVDIIDSETRELMQEQFAEGEQLAEEETEKTAPSRVPDSHFFGVDHNKMQHLMNDITDIEKNVETAALRTMDDVYRQTLNRVQLEMATGSMSINQAVDMAVKDFLEQGINCIVYKDGKHVNIADYVRMALRTTSTRATLQGKASRFAELGYDTVLVSEYGMCSETCLPWQGRVYIDDVFTDWDGEKDGEYGISKYCGKRFPLLSSAMRGGLFHPNCRHSISLWIEGHSKLPEPMDSEKIKERSKAEQKQRALEREVRRHKREVVGLSDEAAVRLAKQKLKQAQAKLKAHIDEHDFLRRDYGREKIYDTPQSSAADQQLNAPETLPNVQTEGHTAEVEVPAPELNYPADSKTYVDVKIPEKSVDISGESGIIEVGRERENVNMNFVKEKHTAAGNRRSPLHILNDSEIDNIKKEIVIIEADPDSFVFNSSITRGTCFLASDNKVHIKGNILPDESSKHPRDKMSVRAVLAHEYYGHKPYREQYLKEDSDTSPNAINRIMARAWADEFRASYMAAKNAPNLTDDDRYLLICDALSRANEAGVTIKYNEFIRRLLYG